MDEIPKPEDSGSSGEQKASPVSDAVVVVDKPLEGLPIVRTLEGLAASNARSMGGTMAAGLLVASVSQISQDNVDYKKEVKELREESKKVNDDLSSCRQAAAVLNERLRSFSSAKNLKNFSIFGGTALGSLAIDSFRGQGFSIGIVLSIIGLVLLVLGWWPFSEGKKDDR